MSRTLAEEFTIERTPLLYVGWAAMVVGMFMAILDIQIVASSLSEIQAGISASQDEIGWVQTSYLVAEVVMIPLSGYLARLLSTRVMFMISAAGFTAFSLSCAFAWSLQSMVVLRALQGFIGGGMIPCVFASLYKVFPREKQAMANVIVGLIVTMAPMAGPTLGGFITDRLGWEWLFLINVIPGLMVLSVVASMPAIDKGDPSLSRGFDFSALLFMALFLGGLEFVLDEGPRDDWFDSRHIVQWSVISAVAGVLFFWRTFRSEKPIIDIRVFRDRNFCMGSLYAFLLGIGLFGSVYILPLFLARVRGLDAFQIGMIMSVSGLFMMMTAPLAGRLSERMDRRLVMGFGIVLVVIGLYLNSRLNHESQFNELFWPQALRGVGIMCMIINANTLALGTLPLWELNNASSLYNLMRNMGGAIGLAAINTQLDSRFHLHYDRLAAWIDPARHSFDAFVHQLPATMVHLGIIGNTPAMRFINGLVTREATVMSFNDVQLMMSIAFAAGLLLLPFIRKPSQKAGGGH